MKLDYFTVAAQLANFLLLLAVLKRFLYGPIVRVMEARERWIADRLGEAKQGLAQASELEAECRARLLELEKLRQQRLAEVEEEAQACRTQLLTQARESVAAQETRWRESQTREWHTVEEQGALRGALVVLEVARRALRDLATADLDEQAVDVFLSRLGEIPSGTPVVSTAFETSPATRVKLRERLPGVRFEVDPGLLAGLELKVGDYRIGWSLKTWLEGLTQELQRC